MPVIINGTTGISGVDGSAASPAIEGGDTDTGLFFPAADTIGFAVGGAEELRIGPVGQIGIAGANYGTSGQVLTSAGSSASPSWSAIPAPAALSTASGSAPSYSPRAWVNFNGITDTIRSSGNVTSIVANLAGDYTVSFTTALPSADYAVSGVIGQYVNANFAVGAVCGYNNTATIGASTTKSTTAYRCQTSWATNTKADCDNVSLIFIV